MLEYERNPSDGKSVLAPGQVKVIGIGGAGSNVLDRIALLSEMAEFEETLALGMFMRSRPTALSSTGQPSPLLRELFLGGKAQK